MLVTRGKQKEKPPRCIKMSPGSLPISGMRPAKSKTNPRRNVTPPTISSNRPIPSNPDISLALVPSIIEGTRATSKQSPFGFAQDRLFPERGIMRSSWVTPKPP